MVTKKKVLLHIFNYYHLSLLHTQRRVAGEREVSWPSLLPGCRRGPSSGGVPVLRNPGLPAMLHQAGGLAPSPTRGSLSISSQVQQARAFICSPAFLPTYYRKGTERALHHAQSLPRARDALTQPGSSQEPGTPPWPPGGAVQAPAPVGSHHSLTQSAASGSWSQEPEGAVGPAVQASSRPPRT